jgi:hypothetical protein
MTTRKLFLFILISCATACSQATSGSSTQTRVQEAGTSVQQLLTIDPVVPRRDFSGAQPDHFEWTAIKGADHYAIGIFNEVDLILWRNDGVAGNSIPWPAGLKLDGGTYFWSVTALQGERVLGDSGRTAFVILQ